MNNLSSRHKRHSPSLCVTRASQSYRHKRHTPLKGVTTVTLAGPSKLIPPVVGRFEIFQSELGVGQ